MSDYTAIEALVRQADTMPKNAHLTEAGIHTKQGDADFCTEFDTRIL